MKNLFILIITLIFTSVVTNSNAQALPYGEYKAMTVTGGATITGADTAYLTGIVDGTGNVTIQANYVRSSGTVTIGGMRLFLSNDGVIYYPYPSSAKELSSTDTLNIADALSTWNLNQDHAAIGWYFPRNIARFYKVMVWTASTGSPVGVISGSTIIRKDNGYK